VLPERVRDRGARAPRADPVGDEDAPDPALFVAAILVHSVLYTRIYNHTGRSVLVAIPFHFAINFVGMLVEGEAWVEWTRTGITGAVALLAVGLWGGRTLRRAPPAAAASGDSA
jgi:uncharacterized protein